MMKDGIEYPDGVDWDHIRDFQKEQLATAKHLAAFCDKHNIRYYLEAGSLLGAMRHGGFIPWDDDIDLTVPRPDYDKLLSLLKSNPDFIVLDWLDTEDYGYAFAKVMRPYVSKECMFNPSAIDVFPMDGVPKSKLIRRIQTAIRLILYYVMLDRKKKIRGIKHYFCAVVGLFLPQSEFKFKRLIERLTLNSSRWEPNSFVGARYLRSGERHYVPFYYCFSSNGVRKSKFEDTEFTVPIEAEKYLEHFFGNWRELPPVENRVPLHKVDDPWFYSAMDVIE